MPRRNNRNPREYIDRLGFNASKYINTVTYGREHADRWPGCNNPYRGDVWFAQLGFAPGTYTTTGRHPVLVLSNNENNYHNAIITVIPITSNTSRLYLPTQVSIRACEMARLNEGVLFGYRSTAGGRTETTEDVTNCGEDSTLNDEPTTRNEAITRNEAAFKDGALLLDQITTIDKALLRGFIGRVRNDKIEEIEYALRHQLGMQE